MNSDRLGNSSQLEGPALMEHDADARVEVLLFLGILFWCWQLMLFFQNGDSLHPGKAPALYWDGNSLLTGKNEGSAPQDETQFPKIPAAITPFLFQPIPVNFADAELLATISGIGPELAGQIIHTRNARGFFTRPEDLLNVPGIGPSRMNQFAPQFSFRLTP